VKEMNQEVKKVISRVKEAQVQLQSLIKSQDWVEEARKYAERQGKEVKKLFAPDVEKMKSFLERERKELERFQKQIPSEVKKLKKFVNLQKKEFEKLLLNIRKLSASKNNKKKTSSNSQKTRSKKSSSTGTKKKSPTSVSHSVEIVSTT
jgi:hypothetical protein